MFSGPEPALRGLERTGGGGKGMDTTQGPARVVAATCTAQHSKKQFLPGRAFAVKVAPKRLPVFPFSGFDLYHHFRNDAFYGLYNLLKVQKTGKREVVLGQPLPQTL